VGEGGRHGGVKGRRPLEGEKEEGRKEGKKFRSSSSPSSGNSQRETSRISFQTGNSTQVFLKAYQDQRIKNRCQNGLATVQTKGERSVTSESQASFTFNLPFLSFLLSQPSGFLSQPSKPYPTCFPKLTIFEHRLYRSRLLGRTSFREGAERFGYERRTSRGEKEVGICFIRPSELLKRNSRKNLAGILSSSTTTSIPNLPS